MKNRVRRAHRVICGISDGEWRRKPSKTKKFRRKLWRPGKAIAVVAVGCVSLTAVRKLLKLTQKKGSHKFEIMAGGSRSGSGRKEEDLQAKERRRRRNKEGMVVKKQNLCRTT